MKKNTKIAGIALALLGAAFLLLAGFASCKADDGDNEEETEIVSVSVSAAAEYIVATGSTTLTATPSFSKSVDSQAVSYSWSVSENTGGGTLSASTSSTATLSGKNESSDDVKVTVTVKATYNGKSVTSSCTVTVLASGTVLPTGITLSATTLSLEITDDEANPTSTLKATITPDNGYNTITWTSSNTSVATVSDGVITAVKAGSATITATTVNNCSADCTVTVKSTVATNVIKASDTPLGFAGVNYAMPTFTNVVTVTTRKELMNAIKKENSLIYIDGMIDMSDEGIGSKLPAEGASNIAVSSVMDSWIASKTSNAYTTYGDWVEAYAAVCSTSTDDKKVGNSGNSSLCSMLWTLNDAWKSVIQLNLKSNTTIIGLGSNSGLRGGTISINGIKNVVIRNLTLVDAIDMFPHHEKNDGFNAQFDCITIQGSSTANIWIDHCTMKDTLVMQHVQSGTKEKWQNYDGLCDIKGDGKGITVSNCHMYHHDKTMLVGSDDDEGDNTVRKVSIINNHFDTCVQRLPMARNSQFHVLNNWYTFDTTQSVGDGKSKGDYCIGARKGALIYSEANYFDSDMQYSIRGNSSTASTAKVYDIGSVDKNSKKTSEYTAVSSAPFTVTYSYEPMTAENAKTYVAANAGAGVWTVSK